MTNQTDDAPADAGADPAAAAAAASTGADAGAAADASLLASATETPAATETDTSEHAWLPEKFRVVGEGGTLDEPASARKLAESYKALEAHKGPIRQAPATPEGYVLEAPKDAEGKAVEGIDIEAFAKDPMFQALAKDAHALGVPQEHMQFFVERYMQLAPQVFAGNQALSREAAAAELGKVWPDQATMTTNIKASYSAVEGFSKDIAADQPGSLPRLMQKYGNDPDFLAFTARIGSEVDLGEDRGTPNAALTASVGDIESLQKSEAYWNPLHADHAKTKARVEAHYTQKYGTAPHR